MRSVAFGNAFDEVLNDAQQEADEFYHVDHAALGRAEDERNVMRQALAGCCGRKQYYYFDLDNG